MKGLELSRSFFEEFGLPMIKREFSEFAGRIAAGLAGHGSECFGYDDDISGDHDFEPGFCIWLTEEDDREFGFRLMRSYMKLPKEYRGVRLTNPSIFGSKFRGVRTIGDYYSFYTGSGNVPQSLEEWMSIPDYYLAEATNGEVFQDPCGIFSSIRKKLKSGRPEDVRLKKLASAVFYMAQYGQYNYIRCARHGERTAASVALAEFAKNTAYAVHLLNGTYAPYYKWLFRSMRDLPVLGQLETDLQNLMRFPFDFDNNISSVDEISRRVASEINSQKLSDCTDSYLEPYAYGINEKIANASLRNSPVML